MPFPIPFAGRNNLFLETANFIPFRDLLLNYRGAEREIVLNVIMLMPFGFLYPLIKNKGIVMTVLLSFLFSLTIECTQLLSIYWDSLYVRSFDVTDLITNTIGGFVGYIIYFSVKPILPNAIKFYKR